LHGEFETPEAAIAACKRIVDEFLESAYKPGMSEAELLTQYALFGEDPFIMHSEIRFSARDYASEQAEKIAKGSQ
jgi:hypothetical protein